MTVDLYRDDLGTLSDSELFPAIEAFCRIGEPLQDRPQEDYRLDFKQEWKEDSLRVVASFANTFGGILFIGISEECARPREILGVQSASEIKTKIASSIASNISPTPPYDIGECALPSDPKRRLCVVRVRKGMQLYLLTTKGENNPVYVRNADESRPAQAAELRALIEQRSASMGVTPDFRNRMAEWQGQLGISQKLATQPDTTRIVSSTYFKVIVLPLGHSGLVLDRALEERFTRIVCVHYPGVSGFVPLVPVIQHDEDRGRDWYEQISLHTNLDYERRWRVNAFSDFGFATQTKYPLAGCGDFWSLSDTSLSLISTLTAARSWWEATSYFGDARLIAWLDVRGLKLYQRRDYPSGFAPLFYSRAKWPERDSFPLKFAGAPEYPFVTADMTVPGDVVCLTDTPANAGAVAQVDLNYASLKDEEHELPNTVASVLNQLLRSFKYVANLERLREEVGFLISRYCPKNAP